MKLDRDNIVTFWSEKNSRVGMYSQWYLAPMTIDGQSFNCCEQWMMYSKAILFKDLDVANKILATNDPRTIKALGRTVKNFDSAIWDENKFQLVYKGNLSKFSQHEELKTILLATGNKLLIEASPYDKIWGVGLSYDDQRILDTDTWLGENLLGKAIMQVREVLAEQ